MPADVYTAEEYDSQPSESTEDELFSSDGFHSSSDTEHEVPGNSILNVHAARRNSFEVSAIICPENVWEL